VPKERKANGDEISWGRELMIVGNQTTALSVLV
jgi:hypothetical protein